jgi:hypothetical protein
MTIPMGMGTDIIRAGTGGAGTRPGAGVGVGITAEVGIGLIIIRAGIGVEVIIIKADLRVEAATGIIKIKPYQQTAPRARYAQVRGSRRISESEGHF